MSTVHRLPELRDVARMPEGLPPQLVVLIDVEEEFDWDGGFDRRATSVLATPRLHVAQEVFDAHGIRPLLVVTYPVMEQDTGVGPVRELLQDDRCVVGAHLHPWVNPPYEEDVTPLSSFPGNLPQPLEAAKLGQLADAIERAVGERPRVYQAGRYGLGPHTAAVLEEQGFEVDFSACPPFDYREEGGPDYSRCPLEPYWFGRERRLLGVPVTGAFVGWLRDWGGPLHRWMHRPRVAHAHLPGIAARLGALERLRLSPEGFDVGDQQRLVRDLMRQGVRTFTYSFHSPSLMPGCTPYVRDEDDLQAFLERMRAFFDWFLGELGGEATTPLELKARLAGETLA